MTDHPKLSPDTLAFYMREARILRGAAIRNLFGSMGRISAAIMAAACFETVRCRLRRRRLIFAPRPACPEAEHWA